MKANAQKRADVKTGFFIKTLMLHREITSAQLARRFRVSTAFISQVVHGKRRSSRVQNAMARLFGVRRSVLWPHQG